MSSERLPSFAGWIEHSLERRFGKAQVAPQIIDREVLMRQHFRLHSMGVQKQCPPRGGFRGQSAGQQLAARHGKVAGRDLALTRQRGKYLGVRRQQHRAERQGQLVCQATQWPYNVVGNRHHVLGDAGHRIARPPRNRSETASADHTAPELSACSRRHAHRVLPSLPVRYRATCRQPELRGPCRCYPGELPNEAGSPASPGPGFPPTGCAVALPRPS